MRKVIVEEILNQVYTYKIKIYGLEYEILEKDKLLQEIFLLLPVVSDEIPDMTT